MFSNNLSIIANIICGHIFLHFLGERGRQTQFISDTVM